MTPEQSKALLGFMDAKKKAIDALDDYYSAEAGFALTMLECAGEHYVPVPEDELDRIMKDNR